EHTRAYVREDRPAVRVGDVVGNAIKDGMAMAPEVFGSHVAGVWGGAAGVVVGSYVAGVWGGAAGVVFRVSTGGGGHRVSSVSGACTRSSGSGRCRRHWRRSWSGSLSCVSCQAYVGAAAPYRGASR